jgi:molybdenum cofactor cytidylyltransferase
VTVAAIVLAAGAARRFGTTKQVAELDGRPLVDHAVAAAIRGGCSPVIVVVGHDADAVGNAVAARPAVRVVHNPRYRSGQATSLRAGLDALPADVGAVAVLLGDEPDIDARAVRACLSLWRSGASVVRARYDDGLGHPVVFDRHVWPRLRAITGDTGARVVMERLPDVHECRIPGRRPQDVDVPDDLLRIRDDH